MSKDFGRKTAGNRIIRDESWQQYLRAIQALLEGLSAANSKQEFLDMVVKLIQRESGCKFVGVRGLTEDGYIPYQSYVGFSREFWESENMIQVSKEDCSCTRIVSGKLLPFDMPIINSCGSLCCNDTLLFGQTLSEDEQKMYRGACNVAGYRSVAVIPIRDRETIVGVIHLADYSENQISPVMMEFVETIAPMVGKVLTMDKIEKVLKNTEEKRAILESIVAGISSLSYIIDMGTCELIYASETMEVLYGEGLTGSKCYEVFGYTFPCCDCVVSKGNYDIGPTWERYDEVHDRHYLCEQKAINWPDGRIVQAAFATDITRQRKAEKKEDELKEALRKYQVFFTHSRDIMLFVEWESGKILEANSAAAIAYGYLHQELLTKNIFDLRVEQEQILTIEQMGTAFKDGMIFETVHRRKDGSTFPVEVNSKGEQVGQTRILFSVVRDITERLASQEALRELTAELKAQNEELRVKEDEIAATNDELKSFVNMIAHDFRSPMVNLKGFSTELGYTLDELKQIVLESEELLPKEVQAKVDELLKKDVPEAQNFIDSAVDKLNRMVDALLNMSRMGRREMKYEMVDLSELVTTVLQSHKHQITENNIQITFGYLPRVETDHLAMEQMIGNLLDNAIKYLDRSRPGKIGVNCVDRGNEYVVSIKDNGRGIAVADQEKIFEPFRRSGKLDQPGEGLGLAYVRTLIRKLGGKAWCESEEGIGTTMSFTITKNTFNQ